MNSHEEPHRVGFSTVRATASENRRMQSPLQIVKASGVWARNPQFRKSTLQLADPKEGSVCDRLQEQSSPIQNLEFLSAKPLQAAPPREHYVRTPSLHRAQRQQNTRGEPAGKPRDPQPLMGL